MRICSFIGCVLMLMAFSSCERIKPKPPVATTLDSTLVIPLSTINIPIDYEVTKLQEMVNTKIQGTFLRQWLTLNDKGDSLYIELEKRSNIKLTWHKRTLTYSFPLNVSAKFKKSVAGITFKNERPIQTELTLYLSTELGFDNQWNLQPHSALRDIKWIKDPKLRVGFVKINLKKIVENMIHKEEKKLIPKLDEVFGKLIDTRKVVSKIWMDLQKPISINKKGTQIWLKAEAQNISARLTDTGPELITLDVELKARVQTILEGEPIPPSNTKLPPFKRKEGEDKDLNIYVLVTIEFDKADEILNKTLRDKTLAAEGYSTTIKKLEVYGTNRGLALKVKVKGDVDGQLFINLVPGYDTLHARIYAKDFTFDIDSENALVNSANWLLHDHALDKIQNELSHDLQPYIDILPQLIMQAVGKGKVGEKIDLTIDELTLKPLHHIITSQNLQIVFQANGKAAIGLKEKIFARKKKKTTQL